MKNIKTIVLHIFFVGMLLQLKAQKTEVSKIAAFDLPISHNKTSNLIFPFAIKSVDRGNEALLAQKAKEVENILQVKASSVNMVPTNLTVVTSDGKFYSFLVSFNENPSALNYSFRTSGPETKTEKSGILFTDGLNEQELMAQVSALSEISPFLHDKSRNLEASIALDGIHVSKDLMWFSLHIENRSLIDFDISTVRFFIVDRKRGKRTAVQEIEQYPSYRSGALMIKGKRSSKLFFAFNPFTIDSSKKLIIQLNDKSGSRNLTLKVKYKRLLNPRLLPG